MLRGKSATLWLLLAGASGLGHAGTGEFCTLPNAQGTPTAYECAIKFTAQSSWLSSFKTWLAANKTTGAMACFAPGTYTVPSTLSTNTNLSVDTNRLVLRGVSGLRLCAPTGGAVVQHQTVNSNGAPLTTYAYMPTLQISSSSNVAIKGMNFNNTSVYSPSFAHHVTRAVWAELSSGVRLVDSVLSAPGKQTLTATDSAVTLTGTTVNCGYFCLTGDRGTGASKPQFTVANSQLNLNRVSDPADDHTALWTHFTDFYIADSSVNYTTGQGLVSGVASTVDWVNLSNISVTGNTPQGRPRLFGWIPTHPNYSNVQVSYTGVPPISRAYYCVPGTDNPACDTGHENAGAQGALFRSRPTATSAFSVAPLPPAKVKQILTLNSDGVGLSWATQTLLKNAAALSSRGSQASGAWGGWLDAGDTALTGSFTAPGPSQLLLFNSDGAGGMFSVRSASGSGSSSQMATVLTVPWTPALVASLGGWHDAGDQLLAGDFVGLGRSQVMFFNRDQQGGAFYAVAIDAATGQLQDKLWIGWTPQLQASLAGWLDAGDRLVTGDFTGTGRTQLLFINAAGPGSHGASIRLFNAVSNSFEVVNDVPWTQITGPSVAMWTAAANKTLVGDFLGLGRDQLVWLNPTATGVALSFWAFDSTSAAFREVYTMNWAAGEITAANLGGFVDTGDWQLGF